METAVLEAQVCTPDLLCSKSQNNPDLLCSNGQNNPAVLEELAAASLTSMWDVEREETSSVAAGPNT